MTWHDLSAKMGQLLGPRPVQEIVITRYEDNRVNYQFEGMRGPVTPEDAYKLLSLVAAEVTKQIAVEPAREEAPRE